MSLTDTEEAKIERYAKRFTNPEKQKARVLQIIEMSSEGFSVNDIRHEIGIGYGYVSEARTWGRREGLW